jgi:methyl-accepting chemotaxis protein
MFLTLKARLLGISVLSVVVIVAVLVIETYIVDRERSMVALHKDVSHFTSAYGAGVGQWIKDRQQVMSALKAAIEENPSESPYPKILQAHQSGGFGLTYYGNAEGEMFRQDPSLDKNNSNYDPRERGWYKAAKAEQGPVVTAPYVSKTLQELVVTLTEPVMKGGQMIGAVGSNVTLSNLAKRTGRLEVPGNGYAILVDRSDQIIAHPDAQLQSKSLAAVNPLLAGDSLTKLIKEDQLVETQVDELDRFVYASAIPNTSWALIFVMDKATLLKPLYATLAKQAVIGLVLIVIMSLILMALFKMMFKNLERVSQALKDISEGEGDLTVRIPVNSRDEIGVLAQGFNQFVERLHGIINRLSQTSGRLTQTADHFTDAARNRSQRIQVQQDEINMVATAVTEMASATQEIAGNAEGTAHAARDSVTISESGQVQVEKSQKSIQALASEVQRATDVISDLERHTDHISGILSTISGIAEQTNLLALNAAIEAARAGDHGRGFAVVADEVRVLSQRTHDSTGEIQSMIDTLQKTTQQAVASMGRGHSMASQSVEDADAARDSLAKIISAIAEISDRAIQIASAAEEQTSVTEEISRNTNAISDVASAMADEGVKAADQAETLRALIREIENEVKRFRL